jgi:hypothetical protein
MASKQNGQIVNFTAGEWDQYSLARADLSDHANAAETLTNIYLTTQGAMELAPGSEYLAATPSNSVAVLRPWALSLDASFCLELSEMLVRFISVTDGAFVTLAGADATVGTFSDESGAISPGGDPAPDGEGGGGLYPPADGCTWIEVGGEGGGGFWFCPPVIGLPA